MPIREERITDIEGSSEPLFKNIMALYTGYSENDKELRTIIDFYYHLQTERSVISEVHFNGITFKKKNDKYEMSEAMKSALLKISKIVISEEINHNIQHIHPKYHPDNLMPEWGLNNLLEAMYFSIFYMKPGVEIYKECENPGCKRNVYFLINATATNKKYCCSECANAAAQRRYRTKKMQK